MSRILWKEEETKDLIKTLRGNHDIFEAVKIHNAKWGTDRTVDSIRSKFQASNLDSPYGYLKEKSVAELESESKLDIILKLNQAKSEVKKLQEELQEAHAEAISAKKVKEIIGIVGEEKSSPDTEWLNWKSKKSHGNKGIPTLFLSDFHFDEVVDPAQVEYMNEFNHEIATKRIKNTFNTAMDLLINKTAQPKYDGIVVALGGDLMSGLIHSELAETNEQPILRSFSNLLDLLIVGIGELADNFKKVYVPAVVGNHSRLHEKPRNKNKVYDNFEWLLYQMLKKHFQNDSRITIDVSDSSDISFPVYNIKFLLTHGDQFKGGNGISGLFTPLMLGTMRKQRRQSTVGKPFDVMLCAHFHQYVHTCNFILNGALKGLDEFAYNKNYPYEAPQQALWITHPERGITIRMPVLCDPTK